VGGRLRPAAHGRGARARGAAFKDSLPDPAGPSSARANLLHKTGLSDCQTLDTPIERRKVYEQLAERLLARIAQGHLAPGDPLPTERELTVRYRVGRSSVREALRMLESRGLIKAVGKGAFAVAEFANPLRDSVNLLLALRETSLRELFELRKILEVEAAALAAERRTEDDLAAMRAAVDEMVAGLVDEQRYIRADLQFHLTIAAATGNRTAQHVMHAIRGALQEALASIYYIPGSPQQSIAQHREILSAVTARDATGARRTMWAHLTRVEGDIEAILGDGALPSRAAPGRRGSVRG